MAVDFDQLSEDQKNMLISLSQDITKNREEMESKQKELERKYREDCKSVSHGWVKATERFEAYYNSLPELKEKVVKEKYSPFYNDKYWAHG